MKSNGAALSSEKSISMLIEAFGKNVGGIIAIDRSGIFGVSNNTASMLLDTSVLGTKNHVP